jgi:hypothetical protein
MKRLLPAASLLALATLAAPAFAQTRADRAIATTQGAAPRTHATMPGGSFAEGTLQAPELYPGEMQDVGPQFLVARPQAAPGEKRFNWFEGYADIQYLYTSNALLSENGNQDTGLMVLTVQAAFNLPPFELLGGTVSPHAGYRHQWWLYSLNDTGNQLNNFDFAVSTFFVGFRHNWHDKWVASFSLDYNRFLSLEDDDHEFYVELAPNWALERNFALGEKTQLTAGYYGAYHWTQTDPAPVKHINDRLDSAFGLSLTTELLPKLFLQPYYRLQWSHYSENSDRNDLYNTLGVSAIYAFNDWASIRAFISFESRNSTDDTVADYHKWDSGGGVTFTARF